MNTEKCLFQLDGGDGLTFLGWHGEYTPDIQVTSWKPISISTSME